MPEQTPTQQVFTADSNLRGPQTMPDPLQQQIPLMAQPTYAMPQMMQAPQMWGPMPQMQMSWPEQSQA